MKKIKISKSSTINHLEVFFLIAILLHTIFIFVYTTLYNYAYTLEVNEKESVDFVRDYFYQNANKHSVTSQNIWVENLPDDIKTHIDNIAEDFRQQITDIYKTENIIYIPKITEISITGKTKSNSEKVFYTRHFDGPFYIMPCKIDRY